MNSKTLSLILSQYTSKNLYVIDASIPKSDYISIDLSQSNPALDTFDNSSSKAWDTYITNYLNTHNKQVAFGGYLERRNLYNRSAYFASQSQAEQRNIHLGLDLWCPADTPVLACFDGTIHSFKNNTNFGDYGPTLVLQHKINEVAFYTLYGHLSVASILNLKVGKMVQQGDTIAYLGDASVNGDYAPHLHFQIIIDIQDYVGDYPGVCSLNDLEFFKQNTINPEVVLGLE
ncbi:peptidoglycan DD-metalloendopeptidase family protein [Olleya sp. YS]|uniref:peptidoglycan DD-metalloendopeptidase family protein n=1 Tax=Olleya sp. YS TaxID=3028318 RepID=UPI00243444F0|nr:peptidoglycan DD-metalloendopeptidase family protein [Olleya sp. YS]WGD34073.1 peptidoglycan DD-metalloendopeptidase family protein [Olleya sp. YS]